MREYSSPLDTEVELIRENERERERERESALELGMNERRFTFGHTGKDLRSYAKRREVVRHLHIIEHTTIEF
jgi:hypothetical protein